jgi:hypothetical protein
MKAPLLVHNKKPFPPDALWVKPKRILEKRMITTAHCIYGFPIGVDDLSTSAYLTNFSRVLFALIS